MTLGHWGGSSKRIKTPSGFSGSEGRDSSLLDQARSQLRESPEGAYTVSRVAVGNFTRDISLASGTQAVTGVGFRPRAIIFFMAETAALPQGSWGLDNGTITNCTVQSQNGNLGDATNKSIFWNDTVALTQYFATVSTMDIDGFTVTWTRTGAPTGTISIMYMALARG